ncbi:MAG: hypothetical protein ABJB86_00020 [Bacteroidota bacterium]
MLKQLRAACFITLFMLCTAIHVYAQQNNLQSQPETGNNINAAAASPVKKNYDEDSKSWYAIYNTGNIIHVYLAVTDPLQQRKIVTNGMEIRIGTKGKKNKKTGILFPFNAHEPNEKPMQEQTPGFNGPVNFDSRNEPDTTIYKCWLKPLPASMK